MTTEVPATGSPPRPRTLDVEGPAAPPRRNGELVFAEPWEGRAFGLAMALVESGSLGYPAFRDRLIARIAEWERGHPEGEGFSYYRCWLHALEAELDAAALVAAEDLAARSELLAARPAGHDHGHHHDHGDAHDHGHGDAHDHGHGDAHDHGHHHDHGDAHDHRDGHPDQYGPGG